MGRDLAASFPTARETFQEIDESLHQHLSRLMFEGSESDLTLTENAQPALMAVSMAVMRVLERDCGFEWKRHATYVAGHSLGEYSALAAARALDRSGGGPSPEAARDRDAACRPGGRGRDGGAPRPRDR